MVVSLTGIQQDLHVLVVQRSLTVLRPNQAFHHVICVSNTARDFSASDTQDTHAIVCTEEVSLTPGAVIDEWFVSLKDFRSKGIHRGGRCPVSIDRSRC